ncbi:unnamed protein product [Effrenium voratum]|nr:unnamed protein product [Effrenium voratum]
MLTMGQASPHLLETLAEYGASVLPQMSQKELASFTRSLSGMGLTAASASGEAIFRQAAIKASRQLMTRKDDRRPARSVDLACLSRAFARAASAAGPSSDKFQVAAPDSSELLEAISGFLEAAVKEAVRLHDFRSSPSCLVGVLWAASQCNVPCEMLMKVATTVLLPPDAGGSPDGHLQSLQLSELAELAQALTCLGAEVPELCSAIADVAVKHLQEEDDSVEQQLVASSELLRLLATAGLLASALAKATSEKVATVLKQSDSGRKLPAWVIARCIAGLAVAVPAKYVMQALALLARAAAARIVELLPEEPCADLLEPELAGLL